ncbi:MAG: hypothetical protein QOJ62_2117 [Actinomycetota bacterium]|nr:hypothetical protein [Actinomycetota bacterium]
MHVSGCRLYERCRRTDDSGAIAILVALLSVVLFAFAALVVDIGDASNVRAQAQQAVDVAARVGVQQLAADSGTTDPSTLEAKVKASVRANISVSDSAWTACNDSGAFTPTPGTPCIRYDVTTNADGSSLYSVRVKLPKRSVQATFGGIFGVRSIAVAPAAVAQSGLDAPPRCQPCNPLLGSNGQPVGDPTPPDAVANFDTGSAPNPPVGGPECPVPARYDAQVVVNGDCALAPGLYVFQDEFEVTGALTGTGVTLVFEDRGWLDVRGTLNLTAPPPGTLPPAGLPGVAMLFREGHSSTEFYLGPGFHIVGSVYALGREWATRTGDCTATSGCRLDKGTLFDTAVLWVTKTEFNRTDGVPYVATDDPASPPPSPQPVHLVG